jgi:hypothetical protein
MFMFMFVYFQIQLGWHPVAAVQYTFTHKQYTEYRNGTYITIKKIWEVQAVSRLCELYLGICLTTEEKAQKNLS